MSTNERKPVTPDTVRGHLNNARTPLVAIIGHPELYDRDAIVEMLTGVEQQLRAALDVHDGKVPPPPDILATFQRPDVLSRHERAAADLLKLPRVRAALARARADRGTDGTKA